VDRVRSLRKILTRLCGMNFCTSFACFVLSVVTQQNYPKCTQIVQNAPKHEIRVQWGGSGVFVSKNSETTLWHELLHHIGSFCTKFCKATKQYQMHPDSTKCTETWVLVPTGSIGMCLLRKILTRLRGMNFCNSLAHFALSFVRQLKGPECIQIVQHTPKHEFMSQRGQSGAFIAKNFDTTSWHEFLHHFGPFCTEFCKATKQSRMHPNSTKYTKIWV